ncbi:HlyD family secretion protein [Flavobacterium sp. HJJ]|uniref:HlyD family secretion protein n=1 Tax=Flavobacterium sp. HJJ TaxID=2783792 RepID=UPI00188A5B8C|nr:HlyD family efflux transporter periplasmic adaptor subunit [Flavobacterium sp. HJJ]MBF4472644.1 HlyD family efflux transporter periplasmic adaptor subunit [Flavobacterium sp. HJJ]
MNYKTLPFAVLTFFLFSCKDTKNENDASGTFEATEVIVSAEANGQILALNINEGDLLKENQQVGTIDSTQLHLNKVQLSQNKKAILSGRPDVTAQIASLQEELKNAVSDKKRIANLVAGDVASKKQLDDANTRIAVIQSKIDAQKSSLNTTTSSLNEQGSTVNAQMAQINDQLKKCSIINPINGTVLVKYSNAFEMTMIGKPLYKIADVKNMILRAYITSSQLSQIKIGQKVKVFVDFGKEESKEYAGTISWISDKSEFTPKTIQTKDERANSVYAVKIAVPNDGYLKIGMYGEIKIK